MRSLTSASVHALEHNQVAADDIDWVVAHQANMRILEGVAKRCGRLTLRTYTY